MYTILKVFLFCASWEFLLLLLFDLIARKSERKFTNTNKNGEKKLNSLLVFCVRLINYFCVCFFREFCLADCMMCLYVFLSSLSHWPLPFYNFTFSLSSPTIGLRMTKQFPAIQHQRLQNLHPEPFALSRRHYFIFVYLLS